MAESVDREEENVDPSTWVDKSADAAETNDRGSPVTRPNGLDGKSQGTFEKTSQLNAEEEHIARADALKEGGDRNDQQEENLNKQDSAEEDGKQAGAMDDEDDPFAGFEDVSSMDIYDLSNYTFGKKNEETKSKAMKQFSKEQMADALRKNYSEKGMRRSVGAVILVHSHNFPHILLLQRSDGKGEYALPGGRLRPGESDEEGLQRKLSSKLKPPLHGESEDDQELDIGEKLCNWYAIDFNRRYYPYVPAHVTKPKEELHVYTVFLPSKFMFSVPKNLQLVAVPMFELFNNGITYGDAISAIPALLSRWHINYC